jgi:phosphatidylserine/phosphatidylglycerophosphate/cardiolipin synthase-like enzyme
MRKWMLLVALLCANLMTYADTALVVPVKNDTTIEVGFSPEGSAADLVLKIIQSAKKSIRISAYSFTSPAVARALIKAHRGGVSVTVLVDYKSNILENRNDKSRIALNLLSKAGITVRTVDNYSAHHDKFIIVDDKHVQTGSFNYSAGAAKWNSENVLVVWNSPEVAAAYMRHWQSRFEQGKGISEDSP